MELAICKTEFPSTTKFMLPTTSPTAFFEKSHTTTSHAAAAAAAAAAAHFSDILNFPSNYLFNKSNNFQNYQNNCDTTTNLIVSPSNVPSSTTSLSSSSTSTTTTTSSSTMRLKKNRKVTFLSNLIEVSSYVNDSHSRFSSLYCML